MNKSYLIFLFLLTSTITLGQISENTNNELNSIESLSQNELEDLNLSLNLSQEQKEQIYEIISGVLIKNNQVKSMKLIEEDKKAIIERNEKSKSLMIMEILIGKQKTLYEKKNSQITELKGSND
tara:strand:- start:1070 stop:1441 length:372 start_codon:yes stop_codon:yes gene_type:complete